MNFSCVYERDLLFSRFLSESDFSPRTRLTFLASLKAFTAWCLDHDVAIPDAVALNRWKSYLLGHHQTSTARTYLSAVKVFFKWLSRQGLEKDIGASVKNIRMENSFRRDCLCENSLRQLLALLEYRMNAHSRKTGCAAMKAQRDYVMVLLMVSCGLRVSEVSLLDAEDLDRLAGKPVIWVHGKGRDGKVDYISVTPKLEKLLHRYLESRQPLPPNSPMFVSYGWRNFGKRLSSKSISRIVKGAMVAAGLDSPRLTAHSLRHTAVTLALKHGATLQQVQQFARHRLMETTLRYAHNLELVSNPCSQLVMKSIGRIDGPRIPRLK